MDRPQIIVLERNSIGTDISLEPLNSLGQVIAYENTETEEQIKERVRVADIIVSNKCHLYEKTLEGANHLKLVCNMATGFDNVDTDYCKKRGIPVANAVDYSTASVAQHTFSLALSLLGKTSYYDHYVKSGAYQNSKSFSHFGELVMELDQKTWGIIGMGHIGRRVARIAQAFGCHILYYSPSGRSQYDQYEKVSFDEILRRCDVLSLHCPLSEKTFHLINREALSKMKPTSLLINVARGKVVENQALYEALVSGKIAGAGMDCFEEEPILPENPLLKISDSSKLLMTPHVGWASVEARKRCVMEVYYNIEAFLRGEKRNIVNE